MESDQNFYFKVQTKPQLQLCWLAELAIILVNPFKREDNLKIKDKLKNEDEPK